MTKENRYLEVYEIFRRDYGEEYALAYVDAFTRATDMIIAQKNLALQATKKDSLSRN